MAKGEPPSPPSQRLTPLTSSALSHHQLLFGFLSVISPSGSRAITSLSLSLILDARPVQLVYI